MSHAGYGRRRTQQNETQFAIFRPAAADSEKFGGTLLLHAMRQALFNGFVEGLLFALIGVSFSLIYSTTRRVLFIALGAIYTLAPYLYLGAVSRWGWPGPMCIIIAVALSALLSTICERTVHWPLERIRASPEINFTASLGCFLVLGQFIVLIWGDGTQSFRTVRTAPWVVNEIRISQGQLLSVAVGVVSLLSIFLLFWKSPLGMKLSALSANPPLLSTLGIDVPRLRRFAFALAGALVAVAALAKSADTGFDPHIGMPVVVVGMVAATMGGRGSFCGAAVAGEFLGLLRGVVDYELSSALVEASTFIILAIVLLFAPSGLRELVAEKQRPDAT